MKDPWDTDTDPMDPGNLKEELDRDRVTVTVKAGAGFDVPWLVFHAKDITQANEFMNAPPGADIITSTVDFSRRFQAAYGPAKASGGSSGGYSGGSSYRGTPAHSPAPPGAPSASCPTHGVGLVYSEPFMSGGKQISGRMGCPERGCRAITIWHNKDGSWKQQ